MLAAESARDKETESVNGVNDPTSTAAVIVTPEKFRIISHTKEECVLQVSNVSFENILFRLLTTCPERYLVKPTKGVIKPNASITATIVLNPSALANETDLDVKHDDFRLEYCVMRPNDVIGPRCVNVPNIIKARKQEDRRLVYKKLLRCTLELTSSAGAAGKKAGSVDRAASHPSSTTLTLSGITTGIAAEHRDHRGSRDGSLAATNTNSNSNINSTTTTTDTAGFMTALSTSSSSAAGGLSTKTDLRELEQNTLAAKNRRQMAQQQHQKTKMKTVVYAVSALVALMAAWLMYGWM